MGATDTQNFPCLSRSRLTLGYWLDDAHHLAIEASGFMLQSGSAGFDIVGKGPAALGALYTGSGTSRTTPDLDLPAQSRLVQQA